MGLFDRQTKQLDTATAELEETITALKGQIADLKAATTETDLAWLKRRVAEISWVPA